MISDVNSNKKKWFDAFSKENTIKIGIARKAIRLFELMWYKYRKEEELPVIYSEHAIPFLKKKFDSNKIISLADDSIYYGSTYKRVFTILESVAGDEACIFTLPVIMCEEAKTYLADIIKLPKELEEINLLIEKRDITNYVNNLTESFKKLGKPYDIEFPLFYFQIPEQLDLKEYSKKISETINKQATDRIALDSTYYDVDERCSILLNEKIKKDNYTISTDFRKLRFCERNGRGCITSYAPKFIPDYLLTKDTPLFRDTPFIEIWNEICESIYEIKDNPEYIMHCKRSLVICANYIFSFISFLEIKNILDNDEENSAITNIDYRLDLFDITLLVGDVLAPKIKNLLTGLLNKKESINMPQIGILPIERYEILPNELVEDFSYHVWEDLNHCKTISEFTSIYFSNQYRWIDNQTKSIALRTNERFNFGIGFESLIYKAQLWDKITEWKHLNVSIHKAIDIRIDEGSVVPRYIMDESSNEHIWLRLFRCGENDDKYTTRLHKLVLKILMRIKERYYNSDEFPRVIVETIFNLILGNLIKDEKGCGIFSNLGKIEFDVVFNKEQLSYSVNAKDENQLTFPVYETCVNYNLIKNERDLCEILDTEYSKYLQKDDCLDDRYRSAFNQCIDFIVEVGKVSGRSLLTKMICLLKNCNEGPDLNKNIDEEINKFKAYLKSKETLGWRLDTMRELYYTYPFASTLLDPNNKNVAADIAERIINENNYYSNEISTNLIRILNQHTEQIIENKRYYQKLEFYFYIAILDNKIVSKDISNMGYIYEYINNKMKLPSKLQVNLSQLFNNATINHDEAKMVLYQILEKFEI